MGRKTVYIHRVGTITAGITLVLTGVLFLVRLFFPFFDPYEVIRFWPVLLIMLGIEVLLASSGKTCRVMNEEGGMEEQQKMVYDFPAILLMIKFYPEKGENHEKKTDSKRCVPASFGRHGLVGADWL